MRKDLNGQLYSLVDQLVSRGITLQQARREFEKQFIVATLRTHEGNLTRAAKELGVHRNTLRNKVTDLGIGSDELPGRTRSRGRHPRPGRL